VDLAAALLTVVAAVIAFRQIRRDARKATAIDPGWRAPWQIAGEAARRRLRRRVGRVRAWLRRLFRRQIPTVYGSAQDALGRGDAFNARGIVGESTSVEFRVGVLEHRVEDLGAKVERLDVEVRAAIEAGDRTAIVEALAPDWADVAEVAVIVAAATVAVLSLSF
jgi:hypothetical protein